MNFQSSLRLGGGIETYGGHVCASGPSDPYFGEFTCLMGGLAHPQLLGYLTYYFTYPIT